MSLLGQHPNIVEFYGLSKRGGGNGDEGLDVVTKFEEGGTLQEALGVEGFGNGRRNGGGRKVGKGWQFSGPDRTAWARDMARGLANSHSVGVVHNDVACRNALRSSTDVGAPVLLCDFGMSRILRGNGVEKASLIDVQRCRDKWPVWQMPKESLSFPYTLSQSSDTWMYGTLLYEVGGWVPGGSLFSLCVLFRFLFSRARVRALFYFCSRLHRFRGTQNIPEYVPKIARYLRQILFGPL